MKNHKNDTKNNYFINLIDSFVKEDSSNIILQSFPSNGSQSFCNGKLLVSHNPRLFANLTTKGRINIWLDVKTQNSDNYFLNSENIELKNLEISDIFDYNNRIISEAIWCKTIIKKKDSFGIETTPTLILLERELEYNEKSTNCLHCKKYAGNKYLTIIQFPYLENMNSNEYRIIKLEPNYNLENQNCFNKYISINFNSSDINTNNNSYIKYCRMNTKDLFKIFFKELNIKNVDEKFCDDCFSYDNIQLFTDEVKESGFLMIMSNMIFLSLNFKDDLLYLNRRFLIQNYNSPIIRLSGIAIFSNWFACITLDTCELLLWNYNEGIAFQRFDLKNYLKKCDYKNNIPIKISFMNNLSKIMVVFDELNGFNKVSYSDIKMMIIDLNGLFSQLLCSFYILRTILERSKMSRNKLLDPGEKLKANLLISSGSIPHVQLEDEYSNLTIYPGAFRNDDILINIEKIMLLLSDGSSEYLNILNIMNFNVNEILDQELGWFKFFKNNWFLKEYCENIFMSNIIINTIKNIIEHNVYFKSTSNNELINISYLNKLIEDIQQDISSDYSDYLFSHNSDNKIYSCKRYNYLLNMRERILNKKYKSNIIKELVFLCRKEDFNIEKNRKDLEFIDIIVSNSSILIQISSSNLINQHLSFYFEINNDIKDDFESSNILCELDHINIQRLEFKYKYTILIMKSLNKANWNYFIKEDTDNFYVGIFSHRMSLLKLIQSTIKYQDLDNIEKICYLNKIDTCIIPIIQLYNGFEYEEIELIRDSLSNTPSTLNLEILKLAKNLLEDVDLYLSMEFKKESSELLLKFCLEKIKEYSENIFIKSNLDIDKILKDLSYYSSVFRRYLSIDNNKTNFELNENNQVSENYTIKNIDESIYIRDEIISGNYSSLLSWYLKTNDENKNLIKFRNKILHEIYNLMCMQNTNSLSLSIHMLRQIGENTTRFLKSVLFHTSRRDIRKRLINHLKHCEILSEEDFYLIQFNNELENYYSNTCYTVELNRICTSLFTRSFPYNILKDCDFDSNNFDTENDDQLVFDDNNYINDPIFSSITYPFGGLQALKDGIVIDYGIDDQSIEDNKKILKATNVIFKKCSSNKENVYEFNKENNDYQIDKELLYSSFPDEAINNWKKLKCLEIEDFDMDIEKFEIKKNPSKNETNGQLNNSTFVSNKNLPEQEGSDYVRLNNGKLISIKNSNCKYCLDINEDEDLDIEELLLLYDEENFLFISDHNSKDNLILDPIENSSSLSSINNHQTTGSTNDYISKKGDLTWSKLYRQKKLVTNNNIGYINHSLSYINNWPFETSIRIIIEKTHFQICYVWNRTISEYQTPSKKNEALVYSLIYLMIKKIYKQDSTNNLEEISLNLRTVKIITKTIYIAVFGFIFSHYEWRNIPMSVKYMNETLNILFEKYKIEDLFKYELVNEIIHLYFKTSPKFIINIFLDSLTSTEFIPIYHLKTDLLENKIQKIETEKHLNIKYIIDKCLNFGKYGVYLFKHYITKSKELNNPDSLNIFLNIIKEYKKNSSIDLNEYLSIIYIFLNKKQDLALLSLRQTFKFFKSGLDQETYNRLFNRNLDLESISPVKIIDILIEYFLNFYDNEKNNINFSPYYILSLLFSLDIPKNQILNENSQLFLNKYFPKLKTIFAENKINDHSFQNLQNKIVDFHNPFKISQIIKMTHKDSKPLIKLIDLYPHICKKTEIFENIDEFLDLFLQKLNEINDCNDNQEDIEYKMNLPIIHYLSLGRPFIAFHLLCMRHSRYHNENKDYDESTKIKLPVLTIDEKVEIYKAIYCLAMRNFTRDIVVCSCIIFISMLELPTELLCTDIRVARCIYNHQIHDKDSFYKIDYDKDMDICTDSLNSEKISEIWDLFLKFGPPKVKSYLSNDQLKVDHYETNQVQKEFQDNQKYSNSLFLVLKMLEEAAWASGDIVVGSNRSESDEFVTNNNINHLHDNEDSKNQILNKNQNYNDFLPHTPIWHLVATFCRIHDLPRSLTLLHELARRGEWINFLQECDAQKCPIETVENIINDYISEYPTLKHHLKIALKIDKDHKNEFKYESNKESDYIIKLLYWNNYFHSIKSVKEQSSLKNKDIINEFFSWSFKQVIINSLIEVNTIKILMYYSLLEGNYHLFIEDIEIKDNLKFLINSSINSFLLLESINLILILKSHDDFHIDHIFNFGLDKDNINAAKCQDSLKKFIYLILNDQNSEENNYNIFFCQNSQNKNNFYNEQDDQSLLDCLLKSSIDCITNISNMKYTVKQEYLDILINNHHPTDSIINQDETTILLWKLLSNINERAFLSRTSTWLYGENSYITLLFKSVEYLNISEIEKVTENLEKILIPNKEFCIANKDIEIFLPNGDLLKGYFEEQFLFSYKQITIQDHSLLWDSVCNIYSNSNINDSLIFNLKKHTYRKHIIELSDLSMEEYNISYEQIEKWLFIPEKQVFEDLYESGKYKLLLKYLEISPNIINIEKDENVLIWLEKSFLSEVAQELTHFSTNPLFKSSYIRLEYLNNYFWNQLLELSSMIKKISWTLTPYFLTKISIYCWYLIEKLERCLSICDQVVLISISLHFLFDTCKIICKEINDENIFFNSELSKLSFVPEFFDKKYIHTCIQYCCYKLFFLLIINTNFEELKNDEVIRILQELHKIILFSNEENMFEFNFVHNDTYFELSEQISLKNKASILFTPSGYFNFQNVANVMPFNIHMPKKIQFNDHPVDAKIVLTSIKNITNYMFNITLTYKVCKRFIPNIRNKLNLSKQRFDHKLKLYFQRNEKFEFNDKSNTSINLSRNSQAWDSITDYFIEIIYISFIFIKIISIWCNNTSHSGNDDYISKFLSSIIPNLHTDNQITWRNYLLITNQNEELSLSNITYKMRLQSLLTLFQYIYKIEKSFASKFSYNTSKMKNYLKEFIYYFDLNDDDHLNDLLNCNEEILSKVSNLITKILSSNFITFIIRNIIELSILFEYELKDNDVNDMPVKFKTIFKSCRIILLNNIYINKKDIDNMFIELIKITINKCCDQRNITNILYQISQSVLNPIYIIEELKSIINENTREAIYMNLIIYYLLMVDYNDNYKDESYYNQLMSSAINNINDLLNKFINDQKFDPILFTNLILEIPELTSINKLSTTNINDLLLNISLNQDNDTNKNSNILPNNLIKIIISLRMLDIYNLREFEDKKVNINLINDLKCNDFLAEFLVKKCLSKQWNVSLEFMFSKYGQFDLLISFQIILHSCDLLKQTSHQQLFNSYQKLAALFSLQLFFIHSYTISNNPNHDNSNKFLLNLDSQMQKCVYNKLKCIIPENTINELFYDLNNYEIETNSVSNKKNEFEFENKKIKLLNLDLVELFEIVTNSMICHNPSIINVILSGYEIIYGPIVHSIWPRVLFKNSIISPNFEFIEKYKCLFGYLNFDILESMVNIYKNSLLEHEKKEFLFLNIIKLDCDDDYMKSTLNSHELNIFDLALEWNERSDTRIKTINNEKLIENWKTLLLNFVDDIQLRITICNMIDPSAFSDTIFYNKKLYNDKSLYELEN